MVVRLEEIRTVATGDAASYVEMGRKIADANEKIVASAGQAGAAIEVTDRRVAASGRSFAALVNNLDPAARAMQRLEAGQKQITAAFEAGRISVTRQTELLGLLKERYGAVTVVAGQMGAGLQSPARGLAVLATAAQAAEGRVRGAVGVFRDVTGTLQLLGPSVGGAASAVGALGHVVGNVSDAFGILSAVLSRHPLLVIGTGVAAAAAALIYFTRATDAAKVSQEAYGAAVAGAKAIEDEAAASTERLAEARARAASQALLSARSEQETNLRLLERQRADIQAQIRFSQQGASLGGVAPGQMNEGLAQLNLLLRTTEAQISMTERRILVMGSALAKVSNDLAIAGAAAKMTARDFVDLETGMELAHRGALFPDLKRGAQVLAELGTATDLYAEKLRELGVDLKRGSIGPAEYARSVENLNNWLYQSAPAFERVRTEVSQTAKMYADLEDAQEAAHKPDFAAERKKLNDQFEAAQRVIEQTRTATEVYAEEVKKLDVLQRAGFLTQENYNRRVEQLNQTLYNADPAFAAAREAASKYAKDLERIVERTTDRLVDFGADAFFDALEGKRDDFWASMVTSAKRAFAQMAAEAILRPILLPMIQSVVGGSPGAFGLQQQQGASGFNPFAILQGAQQANSAMSFFSNPLSSLSNLFSPNNFLANALPSLFAPATFSAGATAASAAAFAAEGTLSGAFAGAGALGAAPLAGLAPFLPILAIALPFLLKGLFGGKESVGPNANGILNFGGGRLSVGGLGSDNGGDIGVAREMSGAVVKGFNSIVDSLGLRVSSFPGAGTPGTQVGYFKGKHFAEIGGVREEYDSGEAAVAGFLRRALTAATVEGLSADVRLALTNSRAKTTEELGTQIAFAQGFGRDQALASAGPNTRAGQLLGFRYAGEDRSRGLTTSNREYLRQAGELFGEDSGHYRSAQVTVRSRAYAALGLGADGGVIDRSEGSSSRVLEGEAAAIAQARAEFEALGETLKDTGVSAAEAGAAVDRGFNDWLRLRREGFDKGVGNQLLGAQGKGYLVELGGLEESRTRALADARALGADMAQVEALYGQLRLNAFEKFTLAQLDEAEAYYRAHGQLTTGVQAQIDAARQAAAAQAEAARQAAEATRQATLAQAGLDAAQAMGSLYAQNEARRVASLADATRSQIVANDDLLRSQNDLVSSTQQAAREYAQFRDSIEATRFGLMVRGQNPVQRLETLQVEFRRLLALALAGDKAALGQIGGAGEAYSQQASRHYGGGAGFAPIGQEIENGLKAARDEAERQRLLAERQLSEAQQQVRLLEEIRDRLTGRGAAPVGGGEFETLVQAVQQFVGAKASTGLTESQIRSLPEWSYFEAQRREIVNRITDTSYLVNALYRYYGGRRTADGTTGDTGAPEIVARLHALGVPGFERGGRTGAVAFVHPREMIYTGPDARVFNPRETAALLSPPANDVRLGQVVSLLQQLLQVQAQGSLAVTQAIAGQAEDLADMAAGIRRASVAS